MSSPKAVYEPPVVRVWGTVADLTGAGLTHPGTDFIKGSVNPPGHGKK